MRQTRYEFWHEWCEAEGQLYAELHVTDAIGDARRRHDGALTFEWAKGKRRPSVSDLYAVTSTLDEATKRSRLDGRVSIATGAVYYPPATLT